MEIYTLAVGKSRTFPTEHLELFRSKNSGRSSVYQKQLFGLFGSFG